MTLDDLLTRKAVLLTELAEVRSEIKRMKVPKPTRGINYSRYREAYRLRNEGKLYREIGSLLNVTAGRARGMFLAAERMTKRGEL